MSQIKFHIDENSSILKFQQLVNAIMDSINRDQLKEGDMLPSVNQIMKECKLSRDTVFKAYAELKKRGAVESVPNRGYFVSHKISKVFLFLDTFKAYKEVLYHSFIKNLPNNVDVDLHFHHYNINIFDKIINESAEKYSKYIIMNFDHPKVAEVIKKLPQDKLLIIDWKIHSTKAQSTIYQNFGEPVMHCLDQNLSVINKYKEFILYYPPFTYHPKTVVDFFQKFCDTNKIRHKVIYDSNEFKIKKGDLYLLVSDRTLGKFLDGCAEKGYEPGNEVGVISYNETPMKKYVKNGITVISTNFELMGEKAAEFVTNGKSVQFEVPTTLTVRASS